MVVLGPDSFGSRRIAVDIHGNLVTSDRSGNVMIWRAVTSAELASVEADETMR